MRGFDPSENGKVGIVTGRGLEEGKNIGSGRVNHIGVPYDTTLRMEETRFDSRLESEVKREVGIDHSIVERGEQKEQIIIEIVNYGPS